MSGAAMDISEVEWNPHADDVTTKYEVFCMKKLNFVWEIENKNKFQTSSSSFEFHSPLFPSEEENQFKLIFTKSSPDYQPKWSVISYRNQNLGFLSSDRCGEPNITKFTIIFSGKDGRKLATHTSFFIFTNDDDKIEKTTNYCVGNALMSGSYYLKVIVNMEVRKYIEMGPFLVSDPRSNLSRDYCRIFENKSGSDVIFLVGEKEFHAHKTVLTTRCKVFASMFESDLEESKLKKVKIDDIEPDDFEEFLRFLYSEKADFANHALGLLKAADKYDVSNLKAICEEELIKSLTEENCLEILVEADLRLANRLKEKAIKIIISKKSFVDTQDWKNFKKVYRDLADEVYDSAWKTPY